jgi:predicted DNA-binding transcriptional regulator AlpA
MMSAVKRNREGRELVGVAEIAQRFGVDRNTVATTWIRREGDFPVPVVRLAMGPVYDAAEVDEWYRSRPERRPRVRNQAVSSDG